MNVSIILFYYFSNKVINSSNENISKFKKYLVKKEEIIVSKSIKLSQKVYIKMVLTNYTLLILNININNCEN